MAQIGSARVETAGGAVTAPVFELGDSGSGIIEAWRVQTPSGVGFVPLIDPADATHPYHRIETGSGVFALHDAASNIITDGLVHRWQFEGNFNDSEGNNDGTAGPDVSFDTDSQEGDQSALFQENLANPDDATIAVSELSVDADRTGTDTGISFSCWMKIPSAEDDTSRGLFDLDDANTAFLLYTSPGNAIFEYRSSGNNPSLSGNYVDGNWEHMGGHYHQGDDILRFFINGSQVGSGSGGALDNKSNENNIGRKGSDNAMFGNIDDLRVYDRPLTGSEFNDISNGDG